MLYRAARAAARLERREEALDYLRRAAELEPTVAELVQAEPAFDPFRSDLEAELG